MINKELDYSNIDEILADTPDQFNLETPERPKPEDVRVYWSGHAYQRIKERKNKQDTLGYIQGVARDKIIEDFIAKPFAEELKVLVETVFAKYILMVEVKSFNTCTVLTFMPFGSGKSSKSQRNISGGHKKKLKMVRKG